MPALVGGDGQEGAEQFMGANRHMSVPSLGDTVRDETSIVFVNDRDPLGRDSEDGMWKTSGNTEDIGTSGTEVVHFEPNYSTPVTSDLARACLVVMGVTGWI
ncbi:hypothetical protein SARC_07481 [Sphaeroforma arctica JP610]|uniref:Uncharacterized protein n=1 Tax=Sphaeroforma arctica JP610 TaxID=667725 RepID=A0A0L0FU22_9EUKA|nr:hypothetical protein SARC_07481 [Sphaeroforma arctica JP610]KNC80154.1 hypothetical protein SARC_07481 [Sphaeroforma arctica JP610]|eukprot:XP_014154056.1 hypothetical protein SARC_07481 [Sphaeroforma arctica JP610]